MKKYPLLVGGFFAGVFFVVACGIGSLPGVQPSIAETLGKAIDVLYNNTISGLTAVNMQDAIDEIEVRVDSLEEPDLLNS